MKTAQAHQQTYQPPKLQPQQKLQALTKLAELPKSDRQDIINGVQCLPKQTRVKAALAWALRWRVEPGC